MENMQRILPRITFLIINETTDINNENKKKIFMIRIDKRNKKVIKKSI